MRTVYLSLGSNLGDRQENLRQAIARLEAAGVRVSRRSSIYETKPRDAPNQPWFLNQVIEAETDLFPRQLLARVQKVELEMGRKRLRPKGPRTIDIDILLCGETIVRTKELELPHPRLAERRFVLEPLAELAPDLRHPLTRLTVRQMLAGVAGQAVKRLGRQ
ncbi:MAG: 2-amino-4-hydroxy-6-hydroxymethyldihydropteridine diphosphokinase [Bryobacteraceae bacterium]|jgi:2-amino-4-hydroxy-6-hydroxymethyldihydropteridine diphosphokinase